jgi:hypothetical protein
MQVDECEAMKMKGKRETCVLGCSSVLGASVPSNLMMEFVFYLSRCVP